MMKRGARAKNPDVEKKLVEVNIKILKYCKFGGGEYYNIKILKSW